MSIAVGQFANLQLNLTLSMLSCKPHSENTVTFQFRAQLLYLKKLDTRILQKFSSQNFWCNLMLHCTVITVWIGHCYRNEEVIHTYISIISRNPQGLNAMTGYEFYWPPIHLIRRINKQYSWGRIWYFRNIFVLSLCDFVRAVLNEQTKQYYFIHPEE